MIKEITSLRYQDTHVSWKEMDRNSMDSNFFFQLEGDSYDDMILFLFKAVWTCKIVK